jgi:hypothetical protein
MRSDLRSIKAKIPLPSGGEISLDLIDNTNTIGIGTLDDQDLSCMKGTQFSLRQLQDAIRVAITQLYPGEMPYDLGTCLAEIQIATTNEGVPLLIMTAPPAEGLCVVIAGCSRGSA